MPYCAYLRKSRVDIEAEQRGEGETLARHEKALRELAQRMNLGDIVYYREIVSGETISQRPVMQQLLSEVEENMWDGVLVMEVERLARGDTIDQGIVSQCFKYSGTKIITPSKTYDPQNEFDEEYFEFGLFMSRREYKTINRRLQRGREASAKEGKWVGARPPYGYKKVKIEKDKGYTLEIVPEEAKIIKMIFDWYAYGYEDESGKITPIGLQAIARKMNEMHIPPIRHDYWQKATIRDILANPVYAGKIRWGYRKTVKKTKNNQQVLSRPINYDESCIYVDGLHDAIVSEETFEKVRHNSELRPAMPVGYKKEIVGSLAGLIVCAKCGRKMVFRKAPTPQKKPYLVCHARACDNVGAPYHLVEERILSGLQTLLDKYELDQQEIKSKKAEDNSLKNALKHIESEINTLQKQLEKAQDLLEQEVYTIDEYTNRSKILKEKIVKSKEDYNTLHSELEAKQKLEFQKEKIIPEIKHILSVFNELEKPGDKNELLKRIIDKAVYCKEIHGAFKGFSADQFDLTLYPKLQ